jgi:hypothetical protein
LTSVKADLVKGDYGIQPRVKFMFTDYRMMGHSIQEERGRKLASLGLSDGEEILQCFGL